MEESWKVIKDYPNYEVSSLGSVRRIGSNRILSRHMAKGNSWFVKLSTPDGAMSKTIKSLVAEAFVPHEEGMDPDLFDTPVQLVLDTSQITADKIVWRPRWFAIQYRRQLRPSIYPGYWDVPVMNITTGNQHASILTASLHDGVLMKQIYKSAGEGIPTFPHMHRYEFMQNIWDGRRSVHD